MAYIVNNSRGQIIAVIQDGTINTTATSQTLVGKNFTPYGEFVVENTVKQLENFANSVPPVNPIEGQLWYNTAEELMYAYSGEEWKSVSGMTVSTTEPSLDPRFGDLWFNPDTQQVEVYAPTDVGQGWIPVSKVTVSSVQPVGQITGELYYNTFGDQLFVFDGGTWKLIGPEGVPGFPTTRWVSDTILDTNSVAHAVVRGIANGVTVAIMTSETFTILSTQRPTGFVDLVPGINLSNQSLFAGVATSAQKLATPRAINGVLFDGTANITIPDAGSLTAGAYLVGATYTGQFPETWSVDAVASNTANKVVVRDNSGNFAASTITANLIGNVLGTATNVTGVVAAVNGGTGFSSYTPGNILIGNGSSLTSAPLTGAGPITVTSTGNSVTIGYTGGTGNGSVTSVGIAAGEGIGVSDSPVTVSGNITVTNTGVVRVNGGEGIAVDRTNGNVTFTNTGVTQILPGPGISINRGSGVVTVSAPENVTSVELAGSVKLWSGAAPPQNWMIADGRAISRTEYALLFSRIGTIFGAGDGSTTFNIPNLAGRMGIGTNSTYPLGSSGGSADAVVVSHTHSLTDPGHFHGGVQTFRRTPPFPQPNIEQLQAGGPDGPPSSFDQPTLNATTGIAIGNAGVSGAGRNLPPYQSLYYIVKLNDAPNTGGGGGGVIISDDGVASIKMWGGTLEPVNWMFCDGRALPRAAYPELFQAIGVTFGAGDGSTTFNIPNMTNRFAVGAGGLYPAGATGGSADAAVIAHQHQSALLVNPASLAEFGVGPSIKGVTGAIPSTQTGALTSTVGESGTGRNLPPYLSARFIIKVSTGAQTILPIALGGTSANNPSGAINNLLPAQSSNQGRFLTTNGTTVSWAQVDPGLPVQTGQSGRYLTTNGTTASWGVVQNTGFGFEQTWRTFNIRPPFDRLNNVVYTNTTGKPIQVCITGVPVSSSEAETPLSEFLINGVVAYRTQTPSGFPIRDVQIQCIVPPGASYQLRVTSLGISIFTPFWAELR